MVYRATQKLRVLSVETETTVPHLRLSARKMHFVVSGSVDQKEQFQCPVLQNKAIVRLRDHLFDDTMVITP